MKKLNCILLLTSITISCGCSSSNDIPESCMSEDAIISLDICHTLRIPHNTITIRVERINGQCLLQADTKPMADHSSANEYMPFHNQKNLSEKWYREISSLLSFLSWDQIRKKELKIIGLDGSIWTLTYKHGQTENILSVWSPDYDTMQRGLQDFLRVSNSLLQAADIDPKTTMPK